MECRMRAVPRSGHFALVSPDSYACIVPAGSGQPVLVPPPGNRR